MKQLNNPLMGMKNNYSWHLSETHSRIERAKPFQGIDNMSVFDITALIYQLITQYGEGVTKQAIIDLFVLTTHCDKDNILDIVGNTCDSLNIK